LLRCLHTNGDMAPIDFKEDALTTARLSQWERGRLNFAGPLCLWLTGLPGAGKSTIAHLLERRLFAEGLRPFVLDGDSLRRGLNRDLGFSDADRIESIRRATEAARLLMDAGLIVIVAMISPFRRERAQARRRCETDGFAEIFVDAPIAECERRDPKGLYARARRGELVNFTGIDSAYEAPEAPEVHLHTMASGPEESVDQILEFLRGRAFQRVTQQQERR
jgi:bifunctional enzyme CysN/CysC